MYDALLRVFDWIDTSSASRFLLVWVGLSIVAGFGFNWFVERGRKSPRYGIDREEY